MIHRAVFRTAFSRVVPNRLLQGLLMCRDSLLEFHAQPLGCVHAWGVARARHARASLRNGPFRTIPDSLCSPHGFEMSVARPHRRFSTVENRVTSIPRQHMSVRPETQGKHSARADAPSLPHTLADCAWQPAQSHRRFSTVENRPHRPPAPTCQCACKHLSDRKLSKFISIALSLSSSLLIWAPSFC